MAARLTDRKKKKIVADYLETQSVNATAKREVTIDFDDSIIEDHETERNNDRQDLAAGIMNDWEYRMRWYHEDEQTAKSMLTRMEDMTDEEQEEIE